MTDRPQAPPEMRARLRDWFVEEMSVTDIDRPVSPPPHAPEPAPPLHTTRRRWRFLIANAAIVLALVAGLAALGRRDLDRTDPQSDPTDRTTSAAAPPTAPLDIGSILDDACDHLREATRPLPLGAAIAQVERVSAGLVTALDRADTTLSRGRGDAAVDEIRALFTELRSRTADLPTVAAAGDTGDESTIGRENIDQAVDNIDLLLSAAGRRMQQSGAVNCGDLPTLREHS